MEKKSIIEEFKRKTDEIVLHSEEIEDLHFTAKLKNGTRFAFDFNEEDFLRKNGVLHEKEKSRSVSLFNGVFDILAAVGSIALLSLSSSLQMTGNTISNAMLITTYSFFVVFFIVSAVYHIFHESHTRAVKALYIVRHSLLTISLALLCVGINAMGYQNTFIYPAILFTGALSIFFMSIGTKGGTMAASFIQTAFATLISLSCPFDPIQLFLAILVATNSIVGGFSTTKGRKGVNIQTSGIFILLSLLLFYILTSQLNA